MHTLTMPDGQTFCAFACEPHYAAWGIVIRRIGVGIEWEGGPPNGDTAYLLAAYDVTTYRGRLTMKQLGGGEVPAQVYATFRRALDDAFAEEAGKWS